jgi:hypothetical protein
LPKLHALSKEKFLSKAGGPSKRKRQRVDKVVPKDPRAVDLKFVLVPDTSGLDKGGMPKPDRAL